MSAWRLLRSRVNIRGTGYAVVLSRLADGCMGIVRKQDPILERLYSELHCCVRTFIGALIQSRTFGIAHVYWMVVK